MGMIALLILIVPYFQTLSVGSFFQILVFHVLLGIPCACIFSVTPVFITEIFPLSVRCSITNLIYSLAACLGGGITPLIALKLGNNMYGQFLSGFILVMLGSISLVLMFIFLKRNKHTINTLKLVSDM